MPLNTIRKRHAIRVGEHRGCGLPLFPTVRRGTLTRVCCWQGRHWGSGALALRLGLRVGNIVLQQKPKPLDGATLRSPSHGPIASLNVTPRGFP